MPISLDVMPIFKVLTTLASEEPELAKKPEFASESEHTNELKPAEEMKFSTQAKNGNMPEVESERKPSSPLHLVPATNLLNKININRIGISLDKPEISDVKSTSTLCFVIIKNDKFVVTASELELTAMRSLPKALKEAYVVCKILMDLLYYSPRLEGLDDFFITKILPSSYEVKNITFQVSYDEQMLITQNLYYRGSLEKELEAKKHSALEHESHKHTVNKINSDITHSVKEEFKKSDLKSHINVPMDTYLLQPTQLSKEHIKLVHTLSLKILEKLIPTNYKSRGHGKTSFSKQKGPHHDPQNTVNIEYYECPKFFLSEKYAMVIRVFGIQDLELRNNLMKLLL